MRALPDPDELRRAAQQLVAAERALHQVADLVQAGAVTADQVWESGAAVLQRDRLHRLRCGTLERADDLGAIGRALTQAADRADAELATLRRLDVRRRQQEAELSAVRAQPPAPDDPWGTLREGAAADLERELALVALLAAQARERIEIGLAVAEAVLRERLPIDLLEDLIGLKPIADGAGAVRRGGTILLTGLQWLGLAIRHARAVDPALRLLLEERLGLLAPQLAKVPGWAKVFGRFGIYTIPLTIIPDAWQDVQDGGGYPGVRGDVVRVSAALAIPGSIAVLVPIGPVAAVGAVTIGTWTAVTGANALYDNREQIARGIEVGALVAGAYVRTSVDDLRELTRTVEPYVPWGPLGPIGPAVGLGSAAESLLDDLPDLPDLHLDEAIRGLGEPFRLPDLPIGPGLRLPLLPGLPWPQLSWPAVPTMPFIPPPPGFPVPLLPLPPLGETAWPLLSAVVPALPDPVGVGR